MSKLRLVSALAAGALTVGSVAPAFAQTDGADATGIGTTTNQLNLLGIDAGRLLSVDVLSDFARTNTDPGVGAVQALAFLSPLLVDSPAAGISQELPAFSAQSSGEPVTEHDEYGLTANPVISATLVPSDVKAWVDDTGANAGLLSGLTGLDLLGGLVSVDTAQLLLGSKALTDQSDGIHGIELDGVRVLDLGELLAGLGLPLTDLPLDTILGLVDSLGLLDELGSTLEGLGLTGLDLGNLSVESISAAVNSLGADVSALGDLATELVSTTPVCDTAEPVFDLLGNLIGSDPSTLCDDVVTTATVATEQLDALLGILGDVLTAPLAILDGQALLTLDGLQVGVLTTATDSVDTSVAKVTTDLGTITIGDTVLPALGALPAAAAVSDTVALAQNAVNGILSSVDPALGDLVQVSALQETTDVTQNGDTILATAGVTGLSISVLPDVAELLGVIDGFAAVTSVGDELAGLGLALPTAPAISELNTLLAGTPTSGLFEDDLVYALSEGLTVEVASVSQSSAFTPGVTATAPPVTDLPRTGTEQGLLLVLGGLAAIGALGARRLRLRVR